MNSKRVLMSLCLIALSFNALYAEDSQIALEDQPNQYQIKNIQSAPNGFVGVSLDSIKEYAQEINFIPALQVGAQYAAAQAVSEGYFANSSAEIVKIIKFNIASNSQSDTENDWNEDAQYIFDITLSSVLNQIVSAHIVVAVNQISSNYQVLSCHFEAVDSGNSGEEGTENAGSADNEGWAEVNVTKALRYQDFNYMLRYGSKFVLNQGIDNQELYVPEISFFKISKIHSVYKRKSATGIQYKFDIELLAEYIKDLRVNFVLDYNVKDSSLKLDSWAIESTQQIIVDMLG